MREYIRFVMRSRDGLFTYLTALLTVLGVLFAVHMIFLAALLLQGFHDHFSLMLYEVIGTGAGGIACMVMTERMLRICVSGGISRKSFLRGHFRILPWLAMLSTAAISLVYLITDGIFRLTGNVFDSFASVLFLGEFGDSQYQPRIILLNLTLLFCLELAVYMVAMLFVGVKNSFGLPAGLMTAGAIGLLCYVNLPVRSGPWSSFGLVLSLISDLGRWADLKHITESGWNDMGPDIFLFSYLELAAVVLIYYLLFYGLFALLTVRVPVRGKEQEG